VKVSIVVPAFNEAALLAGSLAAIRAAMRAFEDAELIVCDNNSTDRTAQIARSAGAKVVFEPVNQIARARNTGAGAASGDWLLFVDADSYPTMALFEEAKAAMASGCLAGGATVALESADRTIRLWVGAWNFLSRRARWAAGSFIFCEAAAFGRLGQFEASRPAVAFGLSPAQRLGLCGSWPKSAQWRKLDVGRLPCAGAGAAALARGQGRAIPHVLYSVKRAEQGRSERVPV
jgi:glycosyltransferase involved in cell wall biosynthesis